MDVFLLYVILENLIDILLCERFRGRDHLLLLQLRWVLCLDQFSFKFLNLLFQFLIFVSADCGLSKAGGIALAMSMAMDPCIMFKDLECCFALSTRSWSFAFVSMNRCCETTCGIACEKAMHASSSLLPSSLASELSRSTNSSISSPSLMLRRLQSRYLPTSEEPLDPYLDANRLRRLAKSSAVAPGGLLILLFSYHSLAFPFRDRPNLTYLTPHSSSLMEWIWQ